MRHIAERLRAVEPRQVALFLAVAALAAAAMYFGGREAGVGRPTEAGTTVAQEQPAEPAPQNSGESDVEPLTLTLTAPATCEGTLPRGGWEHGLEWDEEKEEWKDIEADAYWYWDSVGTIEVTWAASGGGGGYTITIAGEEHSGASGTAEVSCAQQHGPIIDDSFKGRIHPNEYKPVVDSGLKTITGTVADGSGASAEAAVDVYVILAVDGDHVMKSGETYRVHGWPVTVPDGVDIDGHRGVEESVCVNQLEDGTVDESINCEEIFHLAWGWQGSHRSSYGYFALLSLGMKSGTEQGRIVRLDDPDAPDAASLRRKANLLLDQLADSVGREPQIGGESDAEPLTLTLAAPTMCRVKPADRDLHAIVGPIDEDGENEESYEFGDWFGVANVLVRWQASGGTSPYTLVIDGEPRDAHGEYAGETGSALVSCALEIGETYFDGLWGELERWHRTEPTVDSGLKTIHATVTDSSGATASASIDVYALRSFNSSGALLKAGKTYRVRGHLVTIPADVDMTAGGVYRNDCVGEDCESSFEIFADDGPHGVGVFVGLRTGNYLGRFHMLGDRFLPENDPRNQGGSSEHPLHAKFDELVDSLGQPPHVDRD